MLTPSNSFFFGGKTIAFNVMAKPNGPVCNLNCIYCYYLEKQKLFRDTSQKKMDYPLLELFIKQYIESQQTDSISFVWQGGEPTMTGFDYFEQIIALQKKYAGSKKIENALQTNGTLLNEDWCKFLKDNNFLVGISIDGPEKIHNKYRKNYAGEGSFQKVLNNIELLKRYKVEFNTLTTVNNYSSAYPLEIYKFLKKIGSRFIQFLPVVERTSRINQDENLSLVSNEFQNEADVTDWSVNPYKYGKFLCSIFDEWIKRDVGTYYLQIFDATLANHVGQNSGLCLFTTSCGGGLVMEHNGNVYSCDHYVYPENYLGNIQQNHLANLALSDKQIDFGKKKLVTLPDYCKECTYLYTCHGECPKHRFLKTHDGEKGLNYLCTSYKMFFKHVEPYMKFMAEELAYKRPPANVMKWARYK